ncbi:MAG: hypothetical protein V2G41_09750 [bacterium JZ-2024 1]
MILAIVIFGIQALALSQTFNFRRSPGFVIDGPGEIYVLENDRYPITRGQAKFGWETIGIDQARDRQATLPASIAGLHYITSRIARFYVDVRPGTYKISIIMGDPFYAQNGQHVVIKDGTNVLLRIPQSGYAHTPAGTFMTTTGEVVPFFPAHTYVGVNVASSKLTFEFDPGGRVTTVNSISILPEGPPIQTFQAPLEFFKTQLRPTTHSNIINLPSVIRPRLFLLIANGNYVTDATYSAQLHAVTSTTFSFHPQDKIELIWLCCR